MRSIQGLLSEVAYLERSCDYLKQTIRDVEADANHVQHLDPMQETMVEDETFRAATAIKEHLDLATRYAEDWKSRISEIALSP